MGGKTYKESTEFTVEAKVPEIFQKSGVKIISVKAADQQGNEITSYDKSRLGYAKVLVSSKFDTDALITVNVFDSKLTSLGINSFKTKLPRGESELLLSMFIPEGAEKGSANIYVNGFTDWPGRGGTPVTAEKSIGVKIR